MPAVTTNLTDAMIEAHTAVQQANHILVRERGHSRETKILDDALHVIQRQIYFSVKPDDPDQPWDS